MSELIHLVKNRSFGYARVTTDDQDLSLQIDALLRSGVESNDIFTDKLSGAKEDRPGLAACLDALRTGDTLVVWRLDRLRRSMRHLVSLVEQLKENGIAFTHTAFGLFYIPRHSRASARVLPDGGPSKATFGMTDGRGSLVVTVGTVCRMPSRTGR